MKKVKIDGTAILSLVVMIGIAVLFLSDKLPFFQTMVLLSLTEITRLAYKFSDKLDKIIEGGKQ